jgi:hypothetical protein
MIVNKVWAVLMCSCPGLVERPLYSQGHRVLPFPSPSLAGSPGGFRSNTWAVCPSCDELDQPLPNFGPPNDGAVPRSEEVEEAGKHQKRLSSVS